MNTINNVERAMLSTVVVLGDTSNTSMFCFHEKCAGSAYKLCLWFVQRSLIRREAQESNTLRYPQELLRPFFFFFFTYQNQNNTKVA